MDTTGAGGCVPGLCFHSRDISVAVVLYFLLIFLLSKAPLEPGWGCLGLSPAPFHLRR